MIVLLIQSAPRSLRGELSKWMIEPQAGVYVGSLSGAVRDLLWDKVCRQVREGGCMMIHPAANEQGFAIRSWGDTRRIAEQWEGLYLVRRLPRASASALEQAPVPLRLWAKADPFHPLPCHLVDVGFTALELLKSHAFRPARNLLRHAMACPEELFDGWLGYIVALHDWGKARPNFQTRTSAPEESRQALAQAGLPWREDPNEQRIRHEAISRLWLQEHLLRWSQWNRRSIVTAVAAVAAHHGHLNLDAPKLLSFDGDELWEASRIETEEMVRAVFNPQPWPADFVDHSVTGVLLSGLIVWADWVASNEQLFPLRWSGEDWLDYVDLSRLAAVQAVEQLGLSEKNPWKHIESFSDAWPEFDSPRSVQTAVQQLMDNGDEPGLVIIESPMGEGKSEAAMYLAARLLQNGGGIYVALPTAATSNQMFARVQAFLAAHDPASVETVQLVHGAAWLVDKLSPIDAIEVFDDDDAKSSLAAEWFRPRKRSLLAPYGVGTIDQSLMSVMHVKHGFLRLFGLAGNVLIVDEVHAYDAYMREILTLLLQWARALSIRVILLSATLPKQRRDELVQAYCGDDNSVLSDKKELLPYPFITAAYSDGRVDEHAVDPGERSLPVCVHLHDGLLGDAAGVAGLALERLGNEGCLCIIANTIESARAIYVELKRMAPDVDMLLFHSRFLAKHRHRIENAALERYDKRSLLPPHHPEAKVRPKRSILVATQVVEQSLDLDFDEMISEVAPIDLLLQRVGRLQRHERGDRGRDGAHFHILLPTADSDEFGATEHVYDRYTLLRTRLALSHEWCLPTDMRHLIEAVYGPESDGLDEGLQMVLADARARRDAQQYKMSTAASKFLIPPATTRAFAIGRNARTVFEEDDGLQRFLSAKTRYGDYTMQTLLVETDEWDRLQTGARPSRSRLQELMMDTAALPRWWLDDVEAADGFHPPQRAPRWLPVEKVLCVKDGRWRGVDEIGGPVEISIDEELGVQRTNNGG